MNGKNDIESFVNKLVEHIGNEKVFNCVMEKTKEYRGDWDRAARNIIGEVVKKLFSEFFPDIEVRKAVKVEGDKKRMPRRPTEFFGSYGQYPDICIEEPKKVAIELDHAGKGVGSRFKMALAKASFNFLSGDWEYSIVLFHNHGEKSLKSCLNNQTEKKILNFYQEKLHTKIYLFE
jgi:hypothetical protein